MHSWYKFEFTTEQYDSGIPVKIAERLKNDIKIERQHIKDSSTPKWHQSQRSGEEKTFYLETANWPIEKKIINDYQGLPRDVSNLPSLKEFEV